MKKITGSTNIFGNRGILLSKEMNVSHDILKSSKRDYIKQILTDAINEGNHSKDEDSTDDDNDGEVTADDDDDGEDRKPSSSNSNGRGLSKN